MDAPLWTVRKGPHPGIHAGFATVYLLPLTNKRHNYSPVCPTSHDFQGRKSLRACDALLAPHSLLVPGTLCLVEDDHVLGGGMLSWRQFLDEAVHRLNESRRLVMSVLPAHPLAGLEIARDGVPEYVDEWSITAQIGPRTAVRRSSPVFVGSA